MSKLKIAIICGGPSSEHEVSCVSAGGVLGGLDKKSFEPILIGITKAGKWVALDEKYPLKINNKAMPTIEDNGSAVELAKGGLLVDGTFIAIDCVSRSCMVNLAKMARFNSYWKMPILNM